MGHKRIVGRDIDWCCKADNEQEGQDYMVRRRQYHSGKLSRLLTTRDVSEASGGDE